MFHFLSFIFMFSYVCGGNSFPKILSKEEEESLIKLSFLGDEEAKEKLIVHNLRLVAHLAKKFNNKNTIDFGGDLISIGTIGLIKAVNTYNPDKKIKLATYASKCIENEILMHIRSISKHGKNVSLQDIIGTDAEGNEITIGDKISADNYNLEETVEKKMQIEQLLSKIDTLSPIEKSVIIMRYGLKNTKEMTQNEIGISLGISRSYVSRIEKKAVTKLLKEIK
ncbi:MAG: RNA polymerase sporulation sigma factor SigK [Defluviitaleaceae bacterium]|nr:RNA polymerase sporulation sigma factor SigK [Defluviitaleaceae bacterium]